MGQLLSNTTNTVATLTDINNIDVPLDVNNHRNKGIVLILNYIENYNNDVEQLKRKFDKIGWKCIEMIGIKNIYILKNFFNKIQRQQLGSIIFIFFGYGFTNHCEENYLYIGNKLINYRELFRELAKVRLSKTDNIPIILVMNIIDKEPTKEVMEKRLFAVNIKLELNLFYSIFTISDSRNSKGCLFTYIFDEIVMHLNIYNKNNKILERV